MTCQRTQDKMLTDESSRQRLEKRRGGGGPFLLGADAVVPSSIRNPSVLSNSFDFFGSFRTRHRAEHALERGGRAGS
eukprot:616500-Rhodomonas_salina.1